MSENIHPPSVWNRRQVMGLAVSGLGLLTGACATTRQQASKNAVVRVPAIKVDPEIEAKYGFDPRQVLREFDYGTVKSEGGQTVREFYVTAINSTIPLNQAVSFVSWNLNGRIPGPTLRATEGDRIRVIFENQGGHSHSLHFHGIHPAEMDGIKPVRNGKTMVYEFDAEPYGVHPYHCHIAPVTRHITKGLYGLLIIDPKRGRPPADEMVLVMGGYDLQNKKRNDLYAFNGVPDFYQKYPIQIAQNQRVRVYLLNMIEFDVAVTFHIHANVFQLYRTGSTLKPHEATDVVTMGTAERHMLEFSYPYLGKYMFHPHQDVIAEQGCMGLFEVMDI